MSWHSQRTLRLIRASLALKRGVDSIVIVTF